MKFVNAFVRLFQSRARNQALAKSTKMFRVSTVWVVQPAIMLNQAFFSFWHFYSGQGRTAWSQVTVSRAPYFSGVEVVKSSEWFLWYLACVASVSVWFRSKEIPRNGTFGFDRARNETRAKKWKRGEGEEKEGNLPFFPPPRSFTCATFLAVFDSRSSFFSPKPYRNACYAGYVMLGPVHSFQWKLLIQEKSTFAKHWKQIMSNEF